MSLPIITALPTPPSPADTSQDFNSKAFALLDAFPELVTEINSWAAALPTVITGTDFSATSTSSLTVGTGSKSLTIQTGKQFQIGQTIRVAETSAPANYMDGQITSYNSGTGALVVEVDTVGGSGTHADWTVSIIPGGSGSFVTLAGIQSLSNKTLVAPVIATISNGGTVTLPSGTYTLAGLTLAQVFTNKTISFTSNTITGTIAEFNAACSDADFATLAGAETLTNKALTAPVITGGTIASATINASNTLDDTGTIAAASPGFRGVPSVTLAGGAGRVAGSQISFILADAGKRVINTLGGWLIPANASVAFPIGTIIGGYNDSALSQTVAITSDTMRLDGTASTGSRTVAQYGRWNAEKVKATEWVISGSIS